jgi:hypothetical protein
MEKRLELTIKLKGGTGILRPHTLEGNEKGATIEINDYYVYNESPIAKFTLTLDRIQELHELLSEYLDDCAKFARIKTPTPHD